MWGLDKGYIRDVAGGGGGAGWPCGPMGFGGDLAAQCVMLRVPGERDTFLMHEWGHFFEEVTAVRAVQVDHQVDPVLKKALGFQLLESASLSSHWFSNINLHPRDVQPALIGRHYITERDSAPVQYNGIV